MDTSGGRGLADPHSAEFRRLADDVTKLCRCRLTIGAYATQRVKRTGQASATKVRIIALGTAEDGAHFLCLLKPASGKDPVSLKGKYAFKPGMIEAADGSGTQVGLHLPDENVVMSMSTQAERDFLIAASERAGFAGRRATIQPSLSRLQSLDDFRCVREGAKARPQSEGAAGLLSSEDDEALLVILNKHGKVLGADSATDARQLRERVHTLAKDLHAQNEAAILSSNSKRSEIVDCFGTIALELSTVQARLMQFTNNLGKKSEGIATVEKERVMRETRQKNYEKLIAEMAVINERLDEARGYVRLLDRSSFQVGERDNLHRALAFLEEFEKDPIHTRYTIQALRDVRAEIDASRSRAAEKLVLFLGENFQNTGARLTAASSRRKKGVLVWKSHSTHQQAWLALKTLMPHVRQLGMRKLFELCRVYTTSMKQPYRQEISNYYKELKSQLEKKKHKPMFYLGQDLKDVKGLEMLEVHQGHLTAGGSSKYAGSDAGTVFSVARSGVSSCSDDNGQEPSRLEELGVVVYRQRSKDSQCPSGVGGSSVGRSSAGGSGGRRSSMFGSDDGASAAPTSKTENGRLLPHTALITSITMSVEVMLGEQEFIEEMFGMSASPTQDSDLVKMLYELFCQDKASSHQASGGMLHVIVSELSRTVDYMHSKCDMMALLPVSIVVSQLQEAMELRSTFISEFLTHMHRDLDAHILVWQGKQESSIHKFPCDVKHCVVLPAYVRFPVFIRRLEDMCRPLPPNANYSKIQDCVTVLSKMMHEKLKAVCTAGDPKYADFFYYKNAAYHVDFLRDVRFGQDSSNLSKKLLHTQLGGYEAWVNLKEEKQQSYLSRSLLQDTFATVFELVAGVQGCLQSRKCEEVALQVRFSRANMQDAIALLRIKTVKGHLETLHKRLHKHFFGHSTSRKMDNFLRQLACETWEALNRHVYTRWCSLETILRSCYSGLSVECTAKDLKLLLSAITSSPTHQKAMGPPPAEQLPTVMSNFALPPHGRPPSSLASSSVA